jgi:hypothetical protein
MRSPNAPKTRVTPNCSLEFFVDDCVEKRKAVFIQAFILYRADGDAVIINGAPRVSK